MGGMGTDLPAVGLNISYLNIYNLLLSYHYTQRLVPMCSDHSTTDQYLNDIFKTWIHLIMSKMNLKGGGWALAVELEQRVRYANKC